jgi:hypothetical protein
LEAIMMAEEQPGMPASGSERPDDNRLYEAAKQRAETIQGFYIHLLIYVVVNAVLFAINALTRGANGAWWFYWPLAGWGIGLVIHATTLLRVFSPEWAERRAQAMVDRSKRT